MASWSVAQSQNDIFRSLLSTSIDKHSIASEPLFKSLRILHERDSFKKIATETSIVLIPYLMNSFVPINHIIRIV